MTADQLGGFGQMALAFPVAPNNSRCPQNPWPRSPPHLSAKAKRVLFLFIHATAVRRRSILPNYKPFARRDHLASRCRSPPSREVFSAPTEKSAHIAVEVFKHTGGRAPGSVTVPAFGKCADDLCIITACTGRIRDMEAHCWNSTPAAIPSSVLLGRG